MGATVIEFSFFNRITKKKKKKKKKKKMKKKKKKKKKWKKEKMENTFMSIAHKIHTNLHAIILFVKGTKCPQTHLVL